MRTKKYSVPYWKCLPGFGKKGNLQGSFLMYLTLNLRHGGGRVQMV